MDKLKNSKIIHYCWFGRNPLTDLAKKCIESWKKYCPDYEIIEWNEDNFDIHRYKYVEEAYKSKKWAFVSDVARLYALVNYGGIYMDTDVEVLKPLDPLLEYEAVSGFESETQIPTGLMGCCKSHKLFKELLDDYNDIHFIKENGEFDLTTNVTRITNVCLKYGLVQNNTLQTINGFTLLPKDYLCPKDWLTKAVNITENTYTIHHFDGSWVSEQEKYCHAICNKLKAKKLPERIAQYTAMFLSETKFNGFGNAVKRVCKLAKKKISNEG